MNSGAANDIDDQLGVKKFLPVIEHSWLFVHDFGYMQDSDSTRLNIVPFRDDLRSFFYDLNIEWLDHHFLIEPYDLQVLSDPENQILKGGGMIFFGEWQGQIVATFALTSRGEGALELNKMAVRKDLRAKGFGHQMMTFIIAFCRKHGYVQIELYSHTKLKNALHLYGKFGFKEVPVSEDSIYERADIRMMLFLDKEKDV